VVHDVSELFEMRGTIDGPCTILCLPCNPLLHDIAAPLAVMPAHDEERPTPIELEELEPSPVDDFPPEQEPRKEEYFPSTQAQRPPLQSSTSSLGLSGHSPPWYCE